jgi:hypothetical protein
MSGKARKTQQQIEDGAAILAGIVGIADAHAAGRIDVADAMAQVVAQRIDTVRRWGHALETDPNHGDSVGELDTILGAYGATTTAHSMGTCLGELERSDLAWEDAMGVLHGEV